VRPNGELLWNRSDSGDLFAGWESLFPNVGSCAPTAGVLRNEFFLTHLDDPYLFLTNVSGKGKILMSNLSPDNQQGLTIDGPQQAPIPILPIAAAGRPGNLVLVATKTDGRLAFNQLSWTKPPDFPNVAAVGWQEIPGEFISDVSPAAAMRDGTLFVFAKSNTGLIFFNQAAFGGAFVGWQEIPGSQVTDVPLAAAARESTLVVFAKTIDGRILFNQADKGGAFVGWQEIPGSMQTDTAVSACARGDTLFVFAKHRGDGVLTFNRAASGKAFVGWKPMQ
jgi:hypothetical protein